MFTEGKEKYQRPKIPITVLERKIKTEDRNKNKYGNKNKNRFVLKHFIQGTVNNKHETAQFYFC